MYNNKKIFNEKRILVTGNSGFKGAWLTLYLNKISTMPTDRTQNNLKFEKKENNKQRVRNDTKQWPYSSYCPDNR